MATHKTFGQRGKILHGQAREVIANVLAFMKKEAEDGGTKIPISNYKQRVMAATGISEKMYKNIIKESKAVACGALPTFLTPRHKGVIQKSTPSVEGNSMRCAEE